MLRHCVSVINPLVFQGPRRFICGTFYLFQSGQWGYGDRRGGNQGDWGDRRGGNQSGYGDRRGGNQSDWGDRRGGNQGDYGDRRGGNQSDWGDRRGGNQGDYGDRRGGNQGDYGDRRGGNQGDYGDRRGGNQGDWGDRRGGNQGDYGDRRGGNQGHWGDRRGGNQGDYGDRRGGNQGDYGDRRGGNQGDYGDRRGGNQGDYGDRRGGNQGDYGDRRGGNQSDWGDRRGGNQGDYGDRRGGNQGDYGDRRGGNQGDYGDRRGGNQGDYGDRRGGNQGDWGDRRGGNQGGYGDRRGGNQGDYGDRRGGNQGDWGDRRGGNQGDYGDRRGGNQGDYGDRRGGNQGDYGDRRGGNQGDWGDRRGGNQGGYGDRRGGNQGDYGDRRGGNQGDYGDRRGGNQGDWGDRRGGNQGDYGARDGRSRNDCEAPTAFVGEVFDEQSAKSLYELKRQFKLSKSEKERREIQRSARRLVRRARVDPSTQDEKSVTLLLNCAAMFRCYPHTEGIKQATDWMRKNIDGLSPQNIALFANAVGALWVMDSETILVNEISPAAEAVYRQMRSVELVMILQAFQRGKIVENSSLQISMLQQLLSLVPQMPIPQLTTLAGVLVDTPLRKSDEASWRGAVDTVVSLAVSSVEKMHSRETISLLKAAPRLDVMEKHSLQLIERAIGTAGFHTDEQVGELFEAVATYRGQQKPCSGELNEKLDELISVLWTRLQKVAPFADAVSATAIMRWARLSGVDVPRDILDVLVQAVKRELPYHRFTFRRVALLGEALALQNASAKELLYLLGDYCIGKRPTRGDRGGRDVDDDDHPQVDVRMDIYSRFLGDLTRARLALENAYSANTDNGEPGESVCSTLPQRLEASVMSASPREVLKSLQVIFTAEDCSLRNRASDDKIIALAEERVVKEGASFMEDLRKATVEKFVTAVKTIPRAEKMIDVLTSCVK